MYDDLPECVCCKSEPADDEYHFYEDAIERVWYLCADCCEFACGVAEIIANVESEVEAWIHRNSAS